MRFAGDDLAQMPENEREGEIGDVLGQDVGRVGHPHAAFLRPFDVDCVEADAVAGDDLELGATVDQCGGSAEFAARGDRPRLLAPSAARKASLSGSQPQLAKVVRLLHWGHVPVRIGADHQDDRLGHDPHNLHNGRTDGRT